ncbi:hypothetical protein OROGR_019135 [Orobanche gracilis]
MGKLVTTAAFNSRLFMKVMPQMWKLQGKVEVRAVEGNLFTFKFLNMEDREQVMKASPWTFDRFSIALKELDVDDNPSHGALTTVPFWVHVHDLPVRFRTEGVAKMLGDVLDGFLDWEEVVDDEGLGVAMRVRAQVDVIKPLLRSNKLLVSRVQIRMVHGYVRCR